jgi:hypothetical protein
LPPKVVAQDALDAQETVLAVFDHIPAEVLGQLSRRRLVSSY